MQTNKKVVAKMIPTFEGGAATVLSSEKELLRAMATCMLFEKTFYESGMDLAKRIRELAHKTNILKVRDIALYTKDAMKLRHAPIYLALQMLDHPQKVEPKWVVGKAIADVVKRADELAETLAIYWKDGKKPLAAQLKKGLAEAFTKFDEYQLAKWNQLDKAVKLKDVLFLCHAKPKSLEQAKLWEKLIENKLATPWTWEVELSAGKNKKEVFTKLIQAGKLPFMALLMNLRNIEEAGVDRKLVREYLLSKAPNSKALPFRFVTAAKFAPSFAGVLSDAMVSAVNGVLPGTTLVVVDVSGSMDEKLSAKSQMNRIDAAGALAVLLREVCEDARFFTFSHQTIEIPADRGIGLVNRISESQQHGGTYLYRSLQGLAAKLGPNADRVIVITDEQAHDSYYMGPPPCPAKKGYIINVAGYKPALNIKGNWSRIDGWSERVIDWVCFEEFERLLGDFENTEE